MKVNGFILVVASVRERWHFVHTPYEFLIYLQQSMHLKKWKSRFRYFQSFFYVDVKYLFLGIRSLIGKREKIEFAQTVTRFDRKFKGVKSAKRDLIVTQKGIFLIGREQVKKGPNKGQSEEVLTRSIPFHSLYQVSFFSHSLLGESRRKVSVDFDRCHLLRTSRLPEIAKTAYFFKNGYTLVGCLEIVK